ncbi:MAG: hypothetical protein KF784_11660 [Fimbriimonadaceae bacterium]|nr:hypothetical protein [Fimbriimonadaceae bacterium]
MTSANLVENVDVPDILRYLVETLCGQDTIQSASVKAYHSMFTAWEMGEGAAHGFAHCQVSILAGRPESTKTAIADAMWATLRDAFAHSVEGQEANLTLEVREMEMRTYRK